MRVTFNQNDQSVSLSPPVYRMPFAAANRTFTWRDDMLFPVPDDPDERPRALATWDGGQGYEYPPRDTSFPLTPMVLQADDNYSWMATVTPILDGPGHDIWVDGPAFATSSTLPVPPPPPASWSAAGYWKSYAFLNRVTRYTVSIVVFYKRDFECPAAGNLDDPLNPPQERSLQAMFPGDGFGGGDVFLYHDPAVSPLSKPVSWLNVKKNDWIMLRGLELVGPALVTPSPALEPFRRTVAKWYRVVAADADPVQETLPSGTVVTGRYVTLSGPDWRIDTDGDGLFEPTAPLNAIGFYGATGFDRAEATLVDDVIGVYTTTVEADYGSVWTQ